MLSLFCKRTGRDSEATDCDTSIWKTFVLKLCGCFRLCCVTCGYFRNEVLFVKEIICFYVCINILSLENVIGWLLWGSRNGNVKTQNCYNHKPKHFPSHFEWFHCNLKINIQTNTYAQYTQAPSWRVTLKLGFYKFVHETYSWEKWKLCWQFCALQEVFKQK
jgi:hypothetical protein